MTPIPPPILKQVAEALEKMRQYKSLLPQRIQPLFMRHYATAYDALRPYLEHEGEK